VGKKFKKIVIGVVLLVASYYTGGALSGLFFNAGIATLADVAISSFAGPRRQAPPPINVTLRGTVEPRRLVFGRRRVGGVMVFYGASGTDNKYLWYVIAYAGHQSTAFSDFWIDERRIASANIPGGGGGTVTASPWNSKLNIWKYLGTATQNVDTNMNAAFGAWDSNHKLLGTTYAVIRLERDDEVFPDGAPQSVSALVDGMKLYDPRLDTTNGGSGSHRYTNPSTWAFSRNPALMVRWYLTGGSVHNDTTPLKRYGLCDADSRVDDAYTMAAANVCDEVLTGANTTPDGDETRYLCDLEASCDEPRRDIFKALLESMAGTLITVHGKWRISAGEYNTPAHTLSDADLYGELEVQDTIGHDARYNAVAPIFVDANSQYVMTTGIFRTDSAYETQDGGQRIPFELQLDGVTSRNQAQRLAEIHLRKSRMMRSVQLVGALNLLKVAPNENIQFSHTRYGWTNRIFKCKEKQMELDQDAGRITLNCQRDDPGVWTDLETADYTTGTSNTDVFQSDGPDSAINWPGATFVDHDYTAGPVSVSGSGAIQGQAVRTYNPGAQKKNATLIVTATFQGYSQNVAGTQRSYLTYYNGTTTVASDKKPILSGSSTNQNNPTIQWQFDYIAGESPDVSLLWGVDSPSGPNSATYSDIDIQVEFIFR
jgi:hypothetical protein